MAATILDSKGWTVGGVPSGRWSIFSDTVYAPAEGIQTQTTPTTINTLPGNDSLIGKVTTGNGTSFSDPVAGVWVKAGMRLNLGFGDDQVIGEAPVDQPNAYNYGVYNEGAIDTGYSNDLIQGTSRFGVSNAATGSINTGDGSDQIIGASSDTAGASSDYGVINHGVISMGAGKDSITASSSSNGLLNDGRILMGDGADTVDALIGHPNGSGSPGGFQGGGITDLGRGNDVVRGFGIGSFNGGGGTDKLILQDGSYTFTAAGSGFTVTATTGLSGTMTISGFELLGGALDTNFTTITAADSPFVIMNGQVQ